MENKTATFRQPTDRELEFTRIVNASREMVFDIWTNAEHLADWWGPTGFTITTHNFDCKKNGIWKFIMHGPDGRDYPNKIIFLEINRPELIIYKHLDDVDTEGVSFNVTVHFEERGEKTFLSMLMQFNTAEELQRVAREYGAIEGAQQTLSRMEALLLKIQLI